MKALIETIVTSLVDYPEDIVVTEREEETKVVYHLQVHEEDVGKVIGKNGRIAKAIRTVVYAAKTDENKANLFRYYVKGKGANGSSFPFYTFSPKHLKIIELKNTTIDTREWGNMVKIIKKIEIKQVITEKSKAKIKSNFIEQ